eukprot:m.123796 g.123796  ORF g.123796 m.123796 type:complete len:1127 (+) comp14632_c4_seq4:407-3787(+)
MGMMVALKAFLAGVDLMVFLSPQAQSFSSFFSKEEIMRVASFLIVFVSWFLRVRIQFGKKICDRQSQNQTTRPKQTQKIVGKKKKLAQQKMAGFVKAQLVKKLGQYFKDLTTNRLSISLLKGEGTMTDLEVREEFIQETLEFPDWLLLDRAFCDVVRVKVSFTKLKSQAVNLEIDNVVVKLRVDETARTSSKHNSPARKVPRGKEKVEKYGTMDVVADGIVLVIHRVSLELAAPDFIGSLDVRGVCLRGADARWRAANLRESVLYDPRAGTVSIYKLLSLQSVALRLRGRSARLSPEAQAEPVALVLENILVRMARKRAIADCSVLCFKSELIFSPIRISLTSGQIQVLQLVLGTFLQLVADGMRQATATKPDPSLPVPGRAALDEDDLLAYGEQLDDTSSTISAIFELIQLTAIDPLSRRGRFFTSVVLSDLTITHHTDAGVGAPLPNKDSLFKLFMEDRDFWARRSGLGTPGLRQALTFATLRNATISSYMSRASSSSPGDPQHLEESHHGDGEHVNLLCSNYDSFHLPPDTPLVQLVYGECFSDAPGVVIPPPNLFLRINPLLFTLHVAAAVQFLRFAEGARLPSRLSLALAFQRRLQACEGAAAVEALTAEIQASMDQRGLTEDDGQRLLDRARRRMSMLEIDEPPRGATLCMLFELALPVLVIPAPGPAGSTAMHGTPSHVEVKFSRMTISNVPLWSKLLSPSCLRPLSRHCFDTHATLRSAAVPPFLWMRDGYQGPDPPDLWAVHLDQVWIDAFTDETTRVPISRPFTMTLFSFAPYPGCMGSHERPSKELAASYTLLRVSEDLELHLAGAQASFFISVLDEYQRVLMSLDDDAPLPSSMLLFSADSVRINFLPPAPAAVSTPASHPPKSTSDSPKRNPYSAPSKPATPFLVLHVRELCVLANAWARERATVVEAYSAAFSSPSDPVDPLEKPRTVALPQILVTMTGALPAAHEARRFCDAVDRRRAQRKLRAAALSSTSSPTPAPAPASMTSNTAQTPVPAPAPVPTPAPDPAPTARWLSWDEMATRAAELNLTTVPLLFRGHIPDLGALEALMTAASQRPSAVGATLPEGFVVRTAAGFEERDFARHMAKYVRRNHIQTDPNFTRTWRAAALGDDDET